MTHDIRLERRSAQRFAVHDPVCIQPTDNSDPRSGLIQDISSSGMLFYSDAPLSVGDAVELSYAMPEEVTLGERMRIHGWAKILRVTPPTVGTRSSVAVHIERCEFLPERQPGNDRIETSHVTDSVERDELSLSANVFQARPASFS